MPVGRGIRSVEVFKKGQKNRKMGKNKKRGNF